MTLEAPPRKKRVFIASSSRADVGEVREVLRQLDLDPVTLEEFAQPGSTWLEMLHVCLDDADMVVGIVGDMQKNPNIFFELGAASALNKPILLFVTEDYPHTQLPTFDIPYLRTDLHNKEALTFGVRQMLSLSPRSRASQRSEGFRTRPIGPLADRLLRKLAESTPREFEDVIYEALNATAASTIARGTDAEDIGVDFAIWSSDLEPTIGNPLLIECKFSISNQSAVNEAIGQMYRSLDGIRNGWGIVLYKEGGTMPKTAPSSLPVIFLSAEEFINGLRITGLAEFIRTLRNRELHG